MPRRRFRRKDLKRPDEFVSRGNQALEWAQEHTRSLLLGGGTLALCAILVLGFFSVRRARYRQASDDLTQALSSFRGGNYSEATTKLGEVWDRWRSTPAGPIARLYAALADIRNKNFDSAATLLQDNPVPQQWPSYLQQLALLNLAFALEERGDAQGAAAKYAAASGLEGPYTAIAIWEEARCREQAGQNAEALTLYERYAREFPDAPDHEMASAKVDALKAKS
jgi:predicted negative regulator of RcsB-dependent stress response